MANPSYSNLHPVNEILRNLAIEAIPSINYPLPAPRPSNSKLDSGKLRKTFGLILPDWRQDMAHVLAKIITDQAS